MKIIKYNCVENENYIPFVMDGETLEEIEIGTHGSPPSQGRTIIGAKDLKNALEFIDYQDVEKYATSEEVQEAIVILTEWRDFLSGTLPADAEGTREIMSYNLAITALQAYQPWIPVSDRIPTERELRSGMVLAWSTELSEWQVENWGYVEDRPDDYTHWKPLPEPPKGE